MSSSDKQSNKTGRKQSTQSSDSGRPITYFLRGRESESEDIRANKQTESSMAASSVPGVGRTSKEASKEVTNAELRDLMTSLIQSLETKLTTRLQAVELSLKSYDESIKSVKKDVAEVKETIDLQEVRLVAIENTPMGKMENMTSRIEALENQIEYNEYRSRKYNLLLYGVAQTKDENIGEVVNTFLTEDLQIPEEDAEDLMICNYHRIPKRGEGSGPDAIIVKFGRMQDRNMVFNHRSNLPKGKTVRTDLPSRLKKKRAELAKLAYELRKNDKVHTAIRESKSDVWLETRKDKTEKWQKYSP